MGSNLLDTSGQLDMTVDAMIPQRTSNVIKEEVK